MINFIGKSFIVYIFRRKRDREISNSKICYCISHDIFQVKRDEWNNLHGGCLNFGLVIKQVVVLHLVWKLVS